MEAVEQGWQIPSDKRVWIRGEDVRRERTGVHAKISIGIEHVSLAWTNFNVERDEDRLRLANSAHRHLDADDKRAWTPNDMKHALDLFCGSLWERKVGQITVGPMPGIRRAGGPALIVAPFVISGGGTMLYAPPGRGKSYTAMLMAVSIDAGTDVLFNVRTQKPVLYINLERSKESMLDRLSRVNDALGLPESRELAFLHARGKSLSDVLEPARRYAREHIGCVCFLDSVSRAGFGDLNDNQPANKIIDAMNGLCDTWVGLAHTPRSDESHVFGSIHFDAGIDIATQLLTQQKERLMGVGLRVTKANDVPLMRKPWIFALEFDDEGLASTRNARQGEFGLLEKVGRSLLEDAVDYLLRVGEATASEIAEYVGKDRSEISRELGRAQGIGKRKAGKHIFFYVEAA